jgi:hypothetical protein
LDYVLDLVLGIFNVDDLDGDRVAGALLDSKGAQRRKLAKLLE